MKLIKPNFWNYKKPNLTAYLLIPISKIIEKILKIKKKKRKKFNGIKTICVGNFYVGGTGKTSISIEIKKLLDKTNIKSCFVKKKYKDQLDEQKLLKNYGQVYTDTLRTKALKKAIKDGFDVAIFDDGLQDCEISYDLSIVCFNKKNGLGNNLVIPAGPLRESLDNLREYQYIVLSGNDENSSCLRNSLKKKNNKLIFFEATYLPTNLESLNLEKNYLVFSGIGNHSTFVDMLQKNNFKISSSIEFPDHYDYKVKDIEKLMLIAKKTSSCLLTTEKDFIRLSDDVKENIKFVQIELNIKEKDDLNYLLLKLNEKN